jgi:hypothetical protein
MAEPPRAGLPLDASRARFAALQDRSVYLHPDPLECLYVSTAHSDEDIEFTIEAAHEAAKAIGDTPWVPMPQTGAGGVPPQRLTVDEILAFGDKLLAFRSTLSSGEKAFLDEILVRAAAK